MSEERSPAARPDGGAGADDRDRPIVDERMADFEWPVAVGAGLGSALLGYVAIAALFVVGPASFSSSVATLAGRAKQVGQVFYNAQFVDLLLSTEGGGIVVGGRRRNLVLEASNPEIPALVYLALPILALFLVAVYVGHRHADHDRIVSAFAGAGMTVGYAGSLLVLAPLVRSQPATVTIAVDLSQVAAVAVLYPLLLGTLGAAIGQALGRRRGG